jgi:hypothetical protein
VGALEILRGLRNEDMIVIFVLRTVLGSKMYEYKNTVSLVALGRFV